MKNAKPETKKPTLRTETIRRLTSDQMSAVGGCGQNQCDTTSYTTEAAKPGA